MINELTDDVEALTAAALEESWIVTQESSILSSGSNGMKTGRKCKPLSCFKNASIIY